MIARHDAPDEGATVKAGLWAQIAAPLPPEAVSWRQDGKPTQRDGKTFARFVPYTDAHAVRDRLDATVAGEWDLMLDALPPLAVLAGGEVSDEPYAFKARLQILGVIRECVGQGADYKTAATDAFKRAAVRFGIGHELADMGHVWVPMDRDGKYAKPLEDPGAVYARKRGASARNTGDLAAMRTDRDVTAPPVAEPVPARVAVPARGASSALGTEAEATEDPACPKCSGRMWDNRLTKRNAKAPDFKCRDRSCDGVFWPPKSVAGAAPATDEDDEAPF